MFKNLNLGALGLDFYKARSIIYPSRCLPFQEAIEAAKIGGFQGVDIDIAEMKEVLKSKSIDEVKYLVKGNSLKFGGWGLPVDFNGDEKRYSIGLQSLPKYAQIAQELDCKRAFAWDELSFEENLQLHIKRLKPVAEILEDYGCYLGLEFAGIKTLEMRALGIMRLCEAIGTKNLGLVLDSMHWYTTHGTIDQLRRLKCEQIIYVHVNDAPAGIPIEEQRESVRCLPGETGVIDLIGFLKALKKIGYEGPVTPEPYADSPLISLILLVRSFFKESSSLNREIERLLSAYLWMPILKLRMISPRMLFTSMYWLRRLRENRSEKPFFEAVKLTGKFFDMVWTEASLS